MNLADPLYEIPVKCPVCYSEPVLSYKLKSKCQTISVDDLTIPSYKGARGHADADLLPMAPTVCHRCLYTSTQSESFTRLGGLTAAPEVKLSDNLQEALLLSRAERAAILTGLGVTVADFARPRSAKGAFAAYLLTARTAAVKARHRVPRAISEVATAHLYRSVFAREVGGEEAYTQALTDAANAYALVFKEGDHDPKNEDQVIYLCIALHLQLGLTEDVQTFLTAFDRLREKVYRHGPEMMARVKTYHERIKDLLYAAGRT